MTPKLVNKKSQRSEKIGQLKMQAPDGKKTFDESKIVSKVALKELEAKTGKKVVTSVNAKAVLKKSKATKSLK